MQTFKKKNLQDLTKEELVSILLLSISEDNIKTILSSLNEKEIKSISKAMSSLGAVNSIIIEKVLNKFFDNKNHYDSCVGNIEITENILNKSIGKDRANAILSDIRLPEGYDIWEKLINIDHNIVSTYLEKEHPQVITFILSKLPPSYSASIIALLPDNLVSDIIVRMTKVQKIDDELLINIENTIYKDLIENNNSIKHNIDANMYVAEMLNNLDRETESKYISILEEKIPDNIQNIKDMMFVFEDILKLSEKTMKVIIQNIDMEILQIALKGSSSEIKNMFFNNMSTRLVKLFKSDMDLLGPVKLSEIDKSQIIIVNKIKELDKNGMINIHDNQEDLVE